MRYLCIDRRRSQYPVSMMCRVLKVSRSGYYAWRVRPESHRAKTDRELTRVIQRIHIDSDGVYGATKITAELKEEGHQCGRHKVARLMRKAGLKGCPKQSFKVTTMREPSHPLADNRVQHNDAFLAVLGLELVVAWQHKHTRLKLRNLHLPVPAKLAHLLFCLGEISSGCSATRPFRARARIVMRRWQRLSASSPRQNRKGIF